MYETEGKGKITVKRLLICVMSLCLVIFGTVLRASAVNEQNLRSYGQVVVAETKSSSSSYAVLTGYEQVSQGVWERKMDSVDGRVGANGIVPIADRRQSTNTTPAGIMRLKTAMGKDENPGALLPYRQITESLYWDLNSWSPNYNRLVESCPSGYSEHLISYQVYEYLFTTDYNDEQTPGKGAAIFLHCTGKGATGGCVAMPQENMVQCMRWLDPAKEPVLLVTLSTDKWSYFTPDAATFQVCRRENVGNVIHWNAASGAGQYAIERATSAGGPFETVAVCKGADTSMWIDTKGGPGDYYRITTQALVDGQCRASATSAVQRPDGPFVDVDGSAYYGNAVAWAVEQGITEGTTLYTFSPNWNCTRAQAVTFLWRAAGQPEPEGDALEFTDVPENLYYYKAVCWAVEQGITEGIGNKQFAPNLPCTRGQIVTLLWRYAGKPEIESQTEGFLDVTEGAYYQDAVNWALTREITNGTGDGRFCPDGVCTRGQIVTFLWRNDHMK